MSYQSSYDTSGAPFKPNKDRGLWSSSCDFLFACVCNSFRMDAIYGISVVANISKGGLFMIIALLVNVILFAVPIVFIQTFLGQFSSSGFISVFRIAPLFKGMGYVALAINISSLAFYSIFAAVPLLFFVHSLQPTIPWSCESWPGEDHNASYLASSHCQHVVPSNSSEDDDEMYRLLEIPSVEFFAKEVGKSFSFPLFRCVLVVWIGVAFVIYNKTERIGQIFRYSVITLIILLIIIFTRMIFLPGVAEGIFNNYSQAHHEARWELWIFAAPLLTFATFGPGWGTVLTMASYNKFKTDITRFSYLTCLSQFGVMLMMGLICMFAESHLINMQPLLNMSPFGQQWSAFLSIPSSLATLELPHLWNWMFFIVLIIGSFNLVVSQMFSVMTALFDEFESLRPFRKEIIFGSSAILSLVSAAFCSEYGIYFVEIITEVSVSSQGYMNLLLLIVVLWVYGRERFQRDVEFMTSRIIETWKVYVMRFVTPIFLAIALLIGAILIMFNKTEMPEMMPLGIAICIVPFFALPGYCMFKLVQTNGSALIRFKRCIRPTDWYPVDLEDRQRYEETFNNPEFSHPLTTIVL